MSGICSGSSIQQRISEIKKRLNEVDKIIQDSEKCMQLSYQEIAFQKECKQSSYREHNYGAIEACQAAIDGEYDCIHAIKEGLRERNAERSELVRELRMLKLHIG